MKASSVTDQHISFALAVLEPFITSHEHVSSQLNSHASPGQAPDVIQGIHQRALVHSSLLQSELAMKSFLEELHGFLAISVSEVDRFFQRNMHRTTTLSQTLITLEHMFEALLMPRSTFTELFVLRKNQNAWLFYLEQGLNSLASTKKEWQERFNEPAVPIQTIDASNVIASSSESQYGQGSYAPCYWRDLIPNDLHGRLLESFVSGYALFALAWMNIK